MCTNKQIDKQLNEQMDKHAYRPAGQCITIQMGNIRMYRPKNGYMDRHIDQSMDRQKDKLTVIDAPQSGLKGFSQTLNKTIKMRYDTQV
jgi:hypothetical protein